MGAVPGSSSSRGQCCARRSARPSSEGARPFLPRCLWPCHRSSPTIKGSRHNGGRFIGKGKLDTGRAGLDEIVDALRGFLMPPAKAVAAGGMPEMVWPAFGPWQPL